MENNELIIIATLIPVALVVTVIVIVVLFIRKKNKLLIERQENEIRFLSEINKARIEVKDVVLNQVAGELHDNIGQMVALNLMYVKSLQKNFDAEKLSGLRELVEATLNEVRQLSKLLNQDLIQNYRLVEAMGKLVLYLSKLNAIKINFKTKGEIVHLNPNIELIIFRICQEFIGNALKHSGCDVINIEMNFLQERLEINIDDNGKGFDPEAPSAGSGVVAMKKRAQIINAFVTLTSAENIGTKLSLKLNYK